MKSSHFLWLAVIVIAGVYIYNQVDNWLTNNSPTT